MVLALLCIAGCRSEAERRQDNAQEQWDARVKATREREPVVEEWDVPLPGEDLRRLRDSVRADSLPRP